MCLIHGISRTHLVEVVLRYEYTVLLWFADPENTTRRPGVKLERAVQSAMEDVNSCERKIKCRNKK